MRVQVRVLPISLVIPTYHRPRSLANTVRSYLEADALPAEVIVVDQSPEPVRLADLPCDPRVRLRLVREGVACTPRARNRGVRLAEHDVVLFSDDDLLVRPDSLDTLWRSMERPEVALASTLVSEFNPLFSEVRRSSPLRAVGGVLMGVRRPFGRGFYVVKASMRGSYARSMRGVQPAEWASGCFFCVRKSLMEAWDCWFDERLARYATAEDLDFTLRYCRLARRQGLETLIDPAIYANHLRSEEWRMPRAQAARYFVANHRYISAKLYPRRPYYRVMMDVWDTLYALLFCKDRVYAAALLDAVGESRRDPAYFETVQRLEVGDTSAGPSSGARSPVTDNQS